MLRNKIIYSGEVLLDLTGDTVTADDLVTGVTAHDKSGAAVIGSNPYAKTATDTTVNAQATLISQIQTALQGKAAGGETANPILQSKSVTPSETAQTVRPDSGYDGLSQVSVGAISSTYVGSDVTRKSAQTYTPGTSDQSITEGQYLSGKQTIKGDANLLAANIKSGVSIFNVLGTFEGSGSGSSGGLPSGVSALASGTFTPSEDYTSGVQVEHGLGVTPNFVVWWLEDDVSASVLTSTAVVGGIAIKRAKYTASSTIVYNTAWFVNGYNSSSQYANTSGRVSNQNYMTDTTCRLHTSSVYTIKSGYTYRWVCGVVDGVA